MKIAGFVLVTLGVIALVYGGISYNRQRTVLEVGSIKATATEHHTIPLSPIAGVAAIVGGLVLLVIPGRSRA
jgi:drug/metabolite transporter (DMT)-like permease